VRFTPRHEAAHAVCAELLGIEIVDVTVHLEGGGITNQGFPRPGADPEGFPIMLAAGLAGSLIAGQHPDDAEQVAGSDLRWLRKLGHDEAEIASYTTRATELLRVHEQTWRRLTYILAAGTTVSGDVVRSVIAGEPADGRLALAALEMRWAP
jgi:hypothetical protein